MTRSLFGKFLTGHIVIILLLTLTLGVTMSYLIKDYAVERKRKELFRSGLTAASILQSSLNAGEPPPSALIKTISRLTGSVLWLTERDGRLIAGAPPRHAYVFSENARDIKALFDGRPQSWVHTGRRHATPSIVVGIPIRLDDRPAALFLYTPIRGVSETTDTLEHILLGAIFFCIAIAVILAYFLSRNLTRPISDIGRAARAFADGQFDSRCRAGGGGEIAALGRTFNAMADSLAHTEQNRREFLANVAHELKTPIASIQALAETILDGYAADPAQRQRYLSTILKETHYLNRIICDLLDLAQLDAGRFELDCGEVPLAGILAAQREKFALALAEKELRLTVGLPAKPPIVYCDPMRLSQILANLIGNAVRYAPPGSAIELAAAAADGRLRISVTDHGPGIPAEDLPHIWERFYRVDKARSRSDGGTGLGLSIARGLVRAMGGDITAASVPGQTTFSFTLPLKRPTE